MTEDDAKKKWCPFARVFVDYDARGGMMAMTSANRCLPQNDQANLCIGSECMAWRNIRVMVSGTTNPGGPPPKFENNGHGYCGLAGKP